MKLGLYPQTRGSTEYSVRAFPEYEQPMAGDDGWFPTGRNPRAIFDWLVVHPRCAYGILEMGPRGVSN
jgi:hypothetical protein